MPEEDEQHEKSKAARALRDKRYRERLKNDQARYQPSLAKASRRVAVYREKQKENAAAGVAAPAQLVPASGDDGAGPSNIIQAVTGYQWQTRLSAGAFRMFQALPLSNRFAPLAMAEPAQADEMEIEALETAAEPDTTLVPAAGGINLTPNSKAQRKTEQARVRKQLQRQRQKDRELELRDAAVLEAAFAAAPQRRFTEEEEQEQGVNRQLRFRGGSQENASQGDAATRAKPGGSKRTMQRKTQEASRAVAAVLGPMAATFSPASKNDFLLGTLSHSNMRGVLEESSVPSGNEFKAVILSATASKDAQNAFKNKRDDDTRLARHTIAATLVGPAALDGRLKSATQRAHGLIKKTNIVLRKWSNDIREGNINAIKEDTKRAERDDCFSEEVKAAVRDWWAENTRASSNTKNTVRFRGPGGEWETHGVSWYENNLYDLYKSFEKDCPQLQVGRTSWYNLRPEWIRKVGLIQLLPLYQMRDLTIESALYTGHSPLYVYVYSLR